MSPGEVCSVELELTKSNTLPHGLSRVTSSQYRLPPSSKGLTVSQIHISYALQIHTGWDWVKKQQLLFGAMVSFSQVRAFKALDLSALFCFCCMCGAICFYKVWVQIKFKFKHSYKTKSLRRNYAFMLFFFFLKTLSPLMTSYLALIQTERLHPLCRLWADSALITGQLCLRTKSRLYIFWANKWYCLLIMHISFSGFDASLWKHCTLLCQIIQYLTLYESVADFCRSSLNQWPKWQNVLFVHALLNDTKTSQLTGWHRYKSHAQTLDQLHLLPS